MCPDGSYAGDMESFHRANDGVGSRDVRSGLRLLVTLTAEDEERLAQTLSRRLEHLIVDRPRPSSSRQLLTVEEAAAYLRCKKQRIYDLRSQGRLLAKREGRRLLFTQRALDELLEDA